MGANPQHQNSKKSDGIKNTIATYRKPASYNYKWLKLFLIISQTFIPLVKCM